MNRTPYVAPDQAEAYDGAPVIDVNAGGKDAPGLIVKHKTVPPMPVMKPAGKPKTKQ